MSLDPTTEQRKKEASLALAALQCGEVTHVMGCSSTPRQLRAKGEAYNMRMRDLANRIERLVYIIATGEYP